MQAAIPAATAAIPGFGTAMTALKVAQGVSDLAGPQGALVTGDPMRAASAVSGISGGLQGLGGGAGVPTTMSKLGMSPEQFRSLSPEVRQELLRMVMGR